MKTLVFAEKPSVGRDIAHILGASQQGRGYLEGPQYVVTWGIGHLVALGEPDRQNPSWKRWALETLPMLPSDWKLAVLPATADQFEIVKGLMHRPDVGDLINAADAGREGELIFRLVYQMAGCTKSFRRLWISSMTDEAIRQGFAALRPGTDYDPLAGAAVCRSRADWLVGMNFTRVYTKRLDVILTVGRVQTPTLAMIVRRNEEIQNFKPVDYWELEADLGDFKALWFDPQEKDYPHRLKTKEAADRLAAAVAQADARMDSVTTTKKKTPPPFLYDLTTLQREANSRFGYTAAHTLEVAQTLYERRKVITYPRTDSRHLSEDLHATISARCKALPPEYGAFLAPLLGGKVPKPKRVFDNAKVSDHHAIIPTEQKVNGFDGWRPEERNIYDLVTRRFLAVFHPDQEYLSTVVIAKVGGDASFKATGKQILNPGWRILYERKGAEKPESAGEEEDDGQTLPPLKKGDHRTVQAAKILTKQTKPPQAFTEATLLQAMETAGKAIEDDELRLAMKDSGLGTPATRAEIIEKLIRVGYLVREKKKVSPTPKGIQLVRFVAPEVTSPELTGSWEKRLADIAQRKGDPDRFMADISAFISRIVAQVKSDRALSMPKEIVAADERGRKTGAQQSAGSSAGGKQAPRAGNAPAGSSASGASQGQGARSATGGQTARPLPQKPVTTAPRGPQGGASPSAQAGPRTRSAGVPPGVSSPAKVPGQVQAASPAGTAPGSPPPAVPRPTFGVCPACGKGNIIEGQRGFGCDRFREGCHYVVWKEFQGKKLSQSMINTLIAGRATRVQKGFVTADGRTVAGRIRMSEDRKGIEFVEVGELPVGGKEPAGDG